HALCVIVRRESLDTNIKRVTGLLVRGQLSGPTWVCRSNSPSRVGDDSSKLASTLRSFWSVEGQNAAEESNFCGHLDHFASRSVVGAFGRADMQPQTRAVMVATRPMTSFTASLESVLR